MAKTYWAQVEHDITPEAIDRLRKGVKLKDGLTAPAKVQTIDEPELWQEERLERHELRYRVNKSAAVIGLDIAKLKSKHR